MVSQFRTTDDGRKVWVSGIVVIDEIAHRVHNGFIYCSPSLNHKAWDITQQKEKCPICFESVRGEQLTLF